MSDTSVKFFHSAMTGAPVLSGTAGALVALLDACLVNGFGLKTVDSLVVTDEVATATIASGHAAEVDTVIQMAGGSALNGEQKVTAITTTAIKFAAPGVANGTITGTITLKLAPAGWEKKYSGTNLAAYKSLDPQAFGHLLRVDDTGTTTARLVGYEAMTDVNTGVGPFPTTAQMPGGGYWTKSSLANATQVTWVLVSDGRLFFLFVAPYSSTVGTYTHGWTRCFGDMAPTRPSGDAYLCGLTYSATATLASQFDGSVDGSSAPVIVTPRNYTGLGSSSAQILGIFTGTGVSGADATLGTFPSPIDGSLRLSRRYVAQAANNPSRGQLPGWLHVPQSLVFDTFKTRDRVAGSGSLAGRNLIAVNSTGASANVAPTSANSGCGFIDITGPWR